MDKGITERAQRQIAMGERISRETGLDRNTCVDAAHFLLDDDRAARQGNDPSWLARVGLGDRLPEASRIERDAVLSWDPPTFAAVVEWLDGLGPTRRADAARLRALRAAIA